MTDKKIANTLVFLHGFGIRNIFWHPYRESALSRHFDNIITPDLNFANLETAVDTTSETVAQISHRSPVYLVGHSLGGVLAAVVAKKLGANAVAKVVILASPYGDNDIPKPILSLLRCVIRYRLLPKSLTRPRFFSAQTPIEVQKKIWQQTVPETRELIADTISQRWFHTDLFPPALPQPSLVIASRGDQVVNFEKSKAFAKALGASLWILDQGRHNDFVFAPEVAQTVTTGMVNFFQTGDYHG